jgi:hypothetical protein
MGTVRIEDIQKRLEECESPDVADHFYSFGQFLLGEALRQMEAHHEQQLRVEVLRLAQSLPEEELSERVEVIRHVRVLALLQSLLDVFDPDRSHPRLPPSRFSH